MSKYKKIKKYLIKYQRENPNFREYKRKYETSYRSENRIAWNLKSWKSMIRKEGRYVTLIKETDYLLNRFLKESK